MPTNYPNPSEQVCVCSHWPLDGGEQIQAAAVTLRTLSKVWDRAYELQDGSGTGRCGCLDVTVIPLVEAQFDALLPQAALVPDGVQAMVQVLSALGRDFGAVNGWLVGSAHAACLVRTSADPAGRGRLTVLRDDHRVIARDWLAADMNAMIAWLLRRAIRVLQSMDMSPAAIRADLIGARHHQAALKAAASILERAALLAVQCAAYVEDFNHRWLDLRAQVAAATALYPLDDAPLLGSAASATWQPPPPVLGLGIEPPPAVWPASAPASATIPLSA